MPTMSLAVPRFGVFGVKSAGVRFWPKPITAYIGRIGLEGGTSWIDRSFSFVCRPPG